MDETVFAFFALFAAKSMSLLDLMPDKENRLGHHLKISTIPRSE